MAAEKLMTVEEVADRIGTSKRYVQEAAKRGEIPMFQVGVRWRITPTALQEWYDSLTKSAQVQQKRA